MKTSLVLQRLYRFSPRKVRYGSHWRWAMRWVREKSRRHANSLTIGSLLLAGWMTSHIYYYNRLVDLESEVETARAQIDVALQKRNHVSRSLTQLLRFHAAYEKDVNKEITTLRANSPASGNKPPTSPEALARIDAVSEQYPQLQVNSTVKHFSESVVASEADIAARITAYNDAVNRYSNVLHMFPGNVFASFLKFRDHDFYAPDDPSILKYRELAP